MKKRRANEVAPPVRGPNLDASASEIDALQKATQTVNKTSNKWQSFGLVMLAAAIVCLVVTVSMGRIGMKEGASPPILLAGLVMSIASLFCRFWKN